MAAGLWIPVVSGSIHFRKSSRGGGEHVKRVEVKGVGSMSDSGGLRGPTVFHGVGPSSNVGSSSGSSSNSSLVVGSSGGSAVRRRSVNLFIVDVVKRIVEETAHKFTIDITAN